MANFTKDDLAYSGYNHTAWPDDDPRLTGKPDSTLLNRGGSNEMVHIINRYMTNKSWTMKATFQKIEAYLKQNRESSKPHAFWRNELDQKFKI